MDITSSEMLKMTMEWITPVYNEYVATFGVRPIDSIEVMSFVQYS